MQLYHGTVCTDKHDYTIHVTRITVQATSLNGDDRGPDRLLVNYCRLFAFVVQLYVGSLSGMAYSCMQPRTTVVQLYMDYAVR